MTTFWAVFGGVLAANVTMTFGMFALMQIKAVRNWIIKRCVDYSEESVNLITERMEL